MTEMGTYLGRPVDVQQYFDGSILVSDDKAGSSLQNQIRRLIKYKLGTGLISGPFF